VQASNNFLLLEELRKNPDVESVFMFGEYLHVTFVGARRALPLPDHAVFEEITPTIEDCFIALMNRV
jgi:hypothetical protein